MIDTKKFLRKRRFLNISKTIFAACTKSTANFFKFAFAERKILFVTNEKIRTLTFGPISQIIAFALIGWVVNLFYQSLQYNEIISEKSQEIARLKTVNTYFEAEFNNINDKLEKVGNYLVSVTGESVQASEVKDEPQTPPNLDEHSMLEGEHYTLEKIKEADHKMAQIKEVAGARIKKIESVIAMTGLNLKKPEANIDQLKKKYPKLKEFDESSNLAQGGPFVPLNKAFDFIQNEQDFSYFKALETAKFVDEIDRLIVLEKITKIIPLSRPMKNNFSISSGFGPRVDPITRGMAIHQGLDFVGANHAKIISPSMGKVILAGGFSNYGNAVVIDHGFGITTRYGHLSAVKVKVGQIVKKGDVIALQGNTGRSTGQHLHYEVRYKNTPLNPRRFIEAGDRLFNNSNTNHVNS